MLLNDLGHFPYPSRRTVVSGLKGIVATTQPIAAQAGLRILQEGGNAIDAAVATAAVQTVVAPTVCGIGGDLFAHVWCKGKLYVLNASGRAPQKLDDEVVRKSGQSSIPSVGPLSVTVPGTPSGWVALNRRFGRLSLSEVLRPAIEYAREGFPVTAVSAYAWERYFQKYKASGSTFFDEWFKCFAPDGRAPEAGAVWKCESQARTLERIAQSNGEDFYRGEIAERMLRYLSSLGGVLSAQDLSQHQPKWTTPIFTNYRGYQIWEPPPNSQGLIALVALKVLEGLDFENCDRALIVHRQVEAIKFAFDAVQPLIGDPDHFAIDVEKILDEAEIIKLRSRISDHQAAHISSPSNQGGTVCLVCADQDGNMVSLLQSNFYGFGSGLVVPETGISLHSRASAFSMDPRSHNFVRGGALPFHTLAPAFISKGGIPIGPLGIIGAHMQPQGHVQLAMNLIDLGLNPQASIDAPRWEWQGGRQLLIEKNFDSVVTAKLANLGHEIRMTNSGANFGRAQIIVRGRNGAFFGASDHRADGCVVAW